MKPLYLHFRAVAVAEASVKVMVYRAVNRAHFPALWDLGQVT